MSLANAKRLPGIYHHFTRNLLLALFSWFLCLWPQTGHSESVFPQRIISMSPSITEILFEIGMGNRVVGVTNFCSYPEEACQLPKIGGLLNPSVEMWIQLRPDLIIYQEGSSKLKENAANLKIPSLAVSLKDMEGIYEAISLIGKTLGENKKAHQLIHRLRSGVESYRKRLKGIPTKSVLLLLSDTNDPSRDLYGVANTTFLGQLLKLAGGENIIQDTAADYPKISKEYIIHRSPEVIIEAGPKSNLSPEEKALRIRKWETFGTIRAVKNRNIHFIGADYILIPGPRLLSIVDQFARAIHPDRFPALPDLKSTGEHK